MAQLNLGPIQLQASSAIHQGAPLATRGGGFEAGVLVAQLLPQPRGGTTLPALHRWRVRGG